MKIIIVIAKVFFFWLVLATTSTINLILADCSQPYQYNSSSDSCGGNVIVLLNLKVVYWEINKTHLQIHI